MLWFCSLFFSTILVVHFPQSAYAQVSPYKNYTVADGLLSNKVFAICQDSTGYMYFATDRGVSVFNGHTFKNFTVKEGMPTNIIYGLYKDKWNRVWAQNTSDQLIAFKDGKIEKNYLLESECRQLNILEGKSGIYVIDNLGILYKEIKNKIVKIDFNEYLENKIFNNFIPLNDDLCLIISNDKLRLYSITENGDLLFLNDIRPNKYKLSNYKSFYAYKTNNYIYMYANDANKILIISLKSNQIISSINLNKLLSENNIIYLPTVKNNQLYIESSNKYITIDSSAIVESNSYNTQRNIEYTRNFKDRNNNLWIGSNFSGVFLNTFNKNEIKSKYLNNKYGRFCKINGYKNNIFVGTTKGILYKFQNNELIQIANLGLDPIHSIDINDSSLIVANTLNVFEIQTKTGLINKDYFSKFNKSEQNKLIFNYPLQKNICKYISRDKDYIYISRLNDFIAINNSSNELQFHFLSNGFTNHISSTNNHVYFSINNSLYVLHKPLKGSDKKQINIPNSLIITDLDVLGNNLIISTNNDDLIHFDSNLIIDQKIQTNTRINNLFINNENKIILSTINGITFLDPKNKFLNINSLSSQDGLNDRNIVDIYSNSNKIYAISNSYFSSLIYTNYKADPFLNLKINLCHNSDCYSGKIVSISRSNTSFKIILEPFEYNSLEQKKYHYSIEGLQNNWNSTANPEINFNLSKPGTYIFRCKLENYKGQISPNESTMQIMILPKWYETVVARILGIIFMVSLLSGIIQFVLKRKKKTEKAKLLADMQISDVKLESLRAQMNPHFVFNAMGSIQNLIQNDQKALADEYLSRFSKLLRLYLESSKNEDILLKDEIQLISKYLEIEKLRFKNRLDFSIEVRPNDLDTSTIKIPSLLLQPIIENALGHGLFHKENGGLISILIEEKAEKIKITIEDNGIGRKKAAQIKSQKPATHISRGLEMMFDRINLVNKKGHFYVTLEYLDLTELSNPVGTRVILNIK
ncbi:MAG: histidine kinase [Saprospiraceae bacterium]|nr:histidine kinase [Candidatus Vicinibacter affinis]